MKMPFGKYKGMDITTLPERATLAYATLIERLGAPS